MLKFLSYTNLYIAIAALLLTLGTVIPLGMNEPIFPYLLLVFFATLLDYNLHRIIKLKLKTDNRNQNVWREKHYSLLLSITIIAAIGLIVSLTLTNHRIFWMLIPYAFMTAIYSFPFSKTLLRNWDIRKIIGVKNFLIAITWTAVTCLIPIKLSESYLPHMQVFLMAFERFLFILSLTIPFDIRDTETDRNAGLKTIPVVIGIPQSIKLTNVILLLFATVSAIHYTLYHNFFMFAAMFISAISTFFILNSYRLKGHPLYYSVFVDGSIAIQGLLLILLVNY